MIRRAVIRGAVLRAAVLRAAVLRAAVLRAAVLRYAVLRCAVTGTSCLLACASREAPSRAPHGAAAQGAHSEGSQSPGSTEPIPTLQLELIGDFNAPRTDPAASPAAAPAAAWDAALGGLSGLYYAERERRLYAVSDDARRHGPRLYTFTVELGPHALRVVPEAVVPLREPEPSGLLEELDAEAITGDGERLFLALESHEERPQQRVSRVLVLRPDGTITGSVPVPADFLPAPAGQPPRGTRSNLGLEGLGLSPGGHFLWTISESSLEQDGPESSFEHGARVRLCRWDLRALAAGGAPVQFLYPIEPVAPRVPGAGGCEGCNGVSELVVLDERRLLVLERSYVERSPDERGRNVVRIFQAEVPELAPGAELPLLPKRLVLDLDDVVPRLDADARWLDNFEGMSLGPRTAAGARTLLLVADDNFSRRQRTVFLAFELR